MVKIKYTEHLNLRLKIRKIPMEYPKDIYEGPEQKFFDNLEGTFIAIKKLNYNKKIRNMMVAYEEENGDVKIITIHPVTDEQIINRIMSKRWRKNG